MENFYEQFKEDGFFLVRGGIPKSTLCSLQEALEPLIINRGDKNRYQTILEPKYFHPAFLEFLNLPNLAHVVSSILRTEPSFAGLAILLGAFKTSLCNWHRDFCDEHPENPALLTKYLVHSVQYNCALYEDSSLWVVPGSHKRLTLTEEKEFVKSVHQKDFIVQDENGDEVFHKILSNMPGAMHVKLEPGDCLFYNSLIWHGAMYKPEWKRATLHGGWKDPQFVPQFESMRWGMDHNPWLAEPSYMGDLGSFFGPSLEKLQNFMKCYV